MITCARVPRPVVVIVTTLGWVFLTAITSPHFHQTRAAHAQLTDDHGELAPVCQHPIPIGATGFHPAAPLSTRQLRDVAYPGRKATYLPRFHNGGPIPSRALPVSYSTAHSRQSAPAQRRLHSFIVRDFGAGCRTTKRPAQAWPRPGCQGRELTQFQDCSREVYTVHYWGEQSDHPRGRHASSARAPFV